MPALKETEKTSSFSVAENLHKYMREHIWNKKKNLPQLPQTCTQLIGSEIFLHTSFLHLDKFNLAFFYTTS